VEYVFQNKNVVTFDVILKKYDSGKNIHLKNKPRKRAWR